MKKTLLAIALAVALVVSAYASSTVDLFGSAGQTATGNGPWTRVSRGVFLNAVMRGAESGATVTVEVLNSAAQPGSSTAGYSLGTITRDANGNGRLAITGRFEWMRATKTASGSPTATHVELSVGNDFE